MTDILAKGNDGKTYYISTNKGEVHVAEQVIKKSGFIEYEEIYYHDVTLHDIHLLVRYGGNTKFTLLRNITKEKLPMHILELKEEKNHD